MCLHEFHNLPEVNVRLIPSACVMYVQHRYAHYIKTYFRASSRRLLITNIYSNNKAHRARQYQRSSCLIDDTTSCGMCVRTFPKYHRDNTELQVTTDNNDDIITPYDYDVDTRPPESELPGTRRRHLANSIKYDPTT